MGQVRAGDHIVASRLCSAPASTWSRGTCRATASHPRWWTAPISMPGARRCAPAKTFFLETPTNPTLEVIDIKAVAEIAHEAGATLVVDNVFSTRCSKPLQLGATASLFRDKHIDGQGLHLGGVILGSEKFIGTTSTRSVAGLASLAVQCVGAAQRAGDAHDARAPAHRVNAGSGACRASRGDASSIRPDHPQAGVAHRRGRGRSLPSRSRAARPMRSGFGMRCGSSASATISAMPGLITIRNYHASAAHPRGTRRAVSAMAWCGSRAGSSIPTILSRTYSPRWRRYDDGR